MIEFSRDKKEMRISIPVANREEVNNYERSILHLLSKIEIESCDSTMKESVKNVYKLLAHIMTVNHKYTNL